MLTSPYGRLSSASHQEQLVGLFGDRSKTPYHTSNRSHTGTPESSLLVHRRHKPFVRLVARQEQPGPRSVIEFV